MVYGKELELATKGFSDIVEITASVEQAVGESGVRDGIVNVSVIGSTASMSSET